MTYFFKRHLPVILLGTTVLGFGIYTLYWMAQMRVFKAEMAKIESGDSAMFAIQARQVSYSGFPYRLKAQFDDVQLVKQRADYTITLETPQLELTRLMWSPTHMILTADQPKLSMRSRGGTHPVKLAWSAESLQSSLRITAQKIERLSFEFGNVIWTDGHMLASPISMTNLQIHLRDSNTPSSDAKLKTKHPVFANLRIMAGGLHAGTVNSPAAAGFNIDIFADLTGGTGLDDTALALGAWAQRGGTVEVRRFTIARPPLVWLASGQMSLDATGAIAGKGVLSTNAAAPTASVVKGQISATVITAQPENIKWRIANSVMQFDEKPVVAIPFQLLDVIE